MTQTEQGRLDFAIDLARRAGELGLTFFREIESLTIESKGHQDLVSNGDREVELFIRAAIGEAYPEDGVVGEEHATTVGTSAYRWVIDPIDGTANFVRGIPAWCVAIACVKEGVTVVGVVHEPSTGETFYGRRGGGAFVNGKPIRASAAPDLTQGALGVGFSSRADLAKVVKLISLIFADGGIIFRNASGALMLAYVAAGRLLGYCEEHMNAWDCLAAMLLIEEAGGTVNRTDPKTVVDHGTKVIAAGASLYQRVEALCDEAFTG